MSAISELLDEAARQHATVQNALRSDPLEPMDIVVGVGNFHDRITQLQIAANQEAEERAIAAHVMPLIQELVDAHFALLNEAMRRWDTLDTGDPNYQPVRRTFSFQNFMRHRQASNRLAPYAGRQQKLETAPGAGTSAAGGVIHANDARDRWIYEQACKVTPWQSILNRLKRRAKWKQIDTITGLRNAAQRYADSHDNLPPLPTRKAGRPAGKM